MFKTTDIINFFPRNLLDETIKLYRGKNLYNTDSQNYRIKTNSHVRSSRFRNVNISSLTIFIFTKWIEWSIENVKQQDIHLRFLFRCL